MKLCATTFTATKLTFRKIVQVIRLVFELKSVHFKKPVAQSSFLSKVLSFLLKAKQSQRKWNTFERNENCATVFLKWTDFNILSLSQVSLKPNKYYSLLKNTNQFLMSKADNLPFCDIWNTVRFISDNCLSLVNKEPCVKCIVYHTLKFEILQTTWFWA